MSTQFTREFEQGTQQEKKFNLFYIINLNMKFIKFIRNICTRACAGLWGAAVT